LFQFQAGQQEISLDGTFRLENPEVVAALEEFGLLRVTGMAEETIDQILRVLQNGTANGDHPRDIARAIRAQIDGMSATRAYTIARTETAHAYSYAALECYSRNGVKKKEWLTAQDRKVDPPCPEYAAEGAINVRSKFGDVHDHPPAHPNCRCALIPNLDGFEMPEDDDLWLGQ
jgi:SPP1 gp7 family putative phage head morphogenesis protein